MPIVITLKDDHHGIGYSGLDPTAALHKKVEKSTAVKAQMKSGSKLSFFGQVCVVISTKSDQAHAVVHGESYSSADDEIGSLILIQC